MANVKINWVAGAAQDQNGNPLPASKEPVLAQETVVTPAFSGTPPDGAEMAIIETDAAVRYRVQALADNIVATAADIPIPATMSGHTSIIACRNSQKIHFIDY